MARTSPPPPWLARAREIVEGRRARFFLSGLIVVSVLPVPGIEDRLRPLFLLAFGLELAVRGAWAVATRDRRGAWGWVFLLVDLAALVSFLPLEDWLGMSPQAERLLVLLRLSRLLVLARFAQDLGRDLYAVLTRREQLQQFGLVTLAVASFAFVAAVVLDQLAIPHDYDGDEVAADERFWDRIWWAFRQLESADNLVENLQVHPLVAVLSLVLTIIGVFIISFIIGLGANVVGQVVRAERRRPVGYRRHSLVIGPVAGAEVLVREFVRIYDKNRVLRRVRLRQLLPWLLGQGPPPRRHALPRMALLGPTADPPAYLVDPAMRWVVYREGEGADAEALDRVAASDAKRVMLVADPASGEDADAVTLASLMAVRARNPSAHVFVEVLESRNAPLVEAVGGPGTFPLDVPHFMGLFLCHHLLAPGIEGVFRDLLTAEGSEFYTHVFVDPEEWRGVRALADAPGGRLAFDEMAACAYHEHGVLLAGVFFGQEPVRRQERGLVPVDRLEPWVNPQAIADDDRNAAERGARAGEVPVAPLRGLIGLADTYLPLQRYARSLVAGRGLWEDGGARTLNPSEGDVAAAVVDAIRVDERPLGRVLVLGFSAALPSLIRGLARFVPGVEVVLLVDAPDGRRVSLRERLARLDVPLFAPDDELDRLPEDGAVLSLERGGRLEVHQHLGEDLVAALPRHRLSSPSQPFDAAVFLSEPGAMDRDARTLTRVLRFARVLESRDLPVARRFHVLAEFDSVDRGEGLRQHLARHGRRLRLTLVSTERIKNYFMVHSAFVPGVGNLYDRLLGSVGDELVRLEMSPSVADVDGTVGLWALHRALGPRGVLPLAVEMDDGEVVLHPPPDRRFAADRVRGLYALADSDVVGRSFPNPGDSLIPPAPVSVPPAPVAAADRRAPTAEPAAAPPSAPRRR